MVCVAAAFSVSAAGWRSQPAVARRRLLFFVRPATASGKLPGILVIHENRGHNPYVEDVARRFAVANYIAFAPDGLTSVGGYPGDDEKGAAKFREVNGPKMMEDFVAAAEWLKKQPQCTGKIGAIGF